MFLKTDDKSFILAKLCLWMVTVSLVSSIPGLAQSGAAKPLVMLVSKIERSSNGSANLTVQNIGTKPITAFAVEATSVEGDGASTHVTSTVDLLPQMLSASEAKGSAVESGALYPGKSFTTRVSAPVTKSAQATPISCKVVALIFLDGTAEASDGRQSEYIRLDRKKVARTEEYISGLLASSADNNSAAAVKTIDARLKEKLSVGSDSHNHPGSGLDGITLEDAVRVLEAPGDAPSINLSRLQRHLNASKDGRKRLAQLNQSKQHAGIKE